MHQRIPGLSIVGLGCSSFSNFFEENQTDELKLLDLSPDHPRVREWIAAIHFAVRQAGITLLDTAPWYGHGTSETVVGFALQDLTDVRSTLNINTKVGRYDADPHKQFDFTKDATLQSVQRSLKRLGVDYIDVLQLHDPEFAPSLDILLRETIPAMLLAQENGWCRRLGMTGYPLSVQHQILEQSMKTFGRNIWDQSLVYSHFNLHDTSLIDPKVFGYHSFAEYCQAHNIDLITAAPLSMCLLTPTGPPSWHPASPQLQVACREAARLCSEHGVNIADLALLFALSHPCLPCTILGIKNVEQVRVVQALATRVAGATDASSHETVLHQILTDKEKQVLNLLRDAETGPFSKVWRDGLFQWNGVQAAAAFWRQIGVEQQPWHEAVITDAIQT